MKITIDIDENEISNFGWSWPPVKSQDENNKTNNDMIQPVIRPGTYYWETLKYDNGWVDGIDRCANCPNNPKNNPNASGFCWCVIPSMYGTGRITF